MSYRVFAPFLPYFVRSRLFGDRERFGKTIDPKHPMWREWQTRSIEFYNANQRQGAGVTVNSAGHAVMRGVDIAGKSVLEIGPGALDHMQFWTGKPSHFTGVDINDEYLGLARERLRSANVPFTAQLVEASTSAALPFPDESFDVVLSFYSLEHIYPIEPYLRELRRLLRPGGIIAGAIPCEGGLAWGLGRFLTSRRWLRKNSTINPDLIICWEHPNFADEVLNKLSHVFDGGDVSFWPLRVPLIDVNLVAQFVLRRPAVT